MKGQGAGPRGMASVLLHGVYRSRQQAACREAGLMGISSLTFTFRIFRVKVDSKVMGHL